MIESYNYMKNQHGHSVIATRVEVLKSMVWCKRINIIKTFIRKIIEIVKIFISNTSSTTTIIELFLQLRFLLSQSIFCFFFQQFESSILIVFSFGTNKFQPNKVSPVFLFEMFEKKVFLFHILENGDKNSFYHKNFIYICSFNLCKCYC